MFDFEKYQIGCEAEYKTCRYKYYKDKEGTLHLDSVTVFDKPIFNPKHIEFNFTADLGGIGDSVVETPERDIDNPVGESGRSVDRSRARALRQYRDYALGDPDFDLFVTLTVSPEKVFDRADAGEVARRLGVWLDNRVRRQGLKYVLVPERHKKGGIHFHGFFNSSAVRLAPSGLRRDPHCKDKRRKNFRADVEPEREGVDIYNVVDYDFGFTTAIPLGDTFEDRQRAVSYCLKYMGKDAEKVGGRWFYHGGKIAAPELVYTDEAIEDFDFIKKEPFSITDNMRCKVVYGWEIDSFKSVNRG